MKNDSTKSYSGNLNKAAFADQLRVHSNTVFFDSGLRNTILSVARKSDNWFDFIAGCNVHKLSVVCNPNGTYTVK